MPNFRNNKKKKYKKKNNCDKNNDSTTNITSSFADLSCNEIDNSIFDEVGDEYDQSAVDKPYAIKYSEIYGRYLVASRDLEKGELLIEVPPLAIGPCAESFPICLGCYIEITIGSRNYRCPECDWPLCDKTCPGIHKTTGHSVWECKSFKDHDLSSYVLKCDEKDIRFVFEAILVVRCLLIKKFNKDIWKKISVMESHNKIRRNIDSLWVRNQELIVNRIKNQWKYTQYTDEEIHTICGFLEVNSFEVGQNGCRARALYDEAYLICHDCTPNTIHSDDPLNHMITVKTAVPIKKGETITLSYSYILQGTLKRREHLHDSKFFWCSCNRCKDPTELSTHASTLLCPKCTNGFILSTDPLDQDAFWKCHCCGYKVCGKSILTLLDKLYDELDSLDVNDINDYEEYLKRYCNVLHKNHYLMLSAKHSLCQLYGRSSGFLINDLNKLQLQRKEQYCRDLLEVVNVLEPGNSRLRGIISYELHAPIMIRITREYENKKLSNQELKKNLREIVKLLQESYQILNAEPIGSPEHSMSLAAQDALKKMGNVN